MRQGIQTGFKNRQMERYGCYFFTLAAWVHFAFNKRFTDDDLIFHWENAIKNDWIHNDLDDPWMRDPVAVFNALAGQNYFRRVSHSQFPPSTKRFPVRFDIQPGFKIPHFALGRLNDEGEVEVFYDPWAPAAVSRGMKVTSFRSFS